MALQRRKILAQMFNRGFGTTTVPSDSGGTQTGDLVGAHTWTTDIDIRDFTPDLTGSNDSTSSFTSALTQIGSYPGAQLICPAGTYSVANVDLGGTGVTGVHIRGAGSGFYDSNNAKTIFKTSGGTTPCFKATSNSTNVTFSRVQFRGPSAVTASLAGYGVQFMDASAANNIQWKFEDCNFSDLAYGFVFGSAGGVTTNQYLFTSFDNCSFFNNNVGIYSQATNVQQFSVRDTLFTNGWNYYVAAPNGAIDFVMENVYIGQMGAGATGAIYAGAVALKWFKGWSEIGDGATVYNGSTFVAGSTGCFLIGTGIGGSTPSGTGSALLSGVYHPRHGDTSYYSIYWAGGPLTIVGGAIGGRIRNDNTYADARVVLTDMAWIPCREDAIVQTSGSSSSKPYMMGTYNGAAAADYYIDIHTDATHFRWKKGAGGTYSSDITIAAHVYIDEGLIVNFPPSVTWVVGHEWKFPCSPCGVVELGGAKPEPAMGVRYTRSTTQAVASATLTTVTYPTARQDTYGLYNTTTGTFTAMVSGWYDIHAKVCFEGQAGTFTQTMGLYVNGSVIDGGQTNIHTSSGNSCSVESRCRTYLNDGDAVTTKVTQDSGFSVNIQASATLNVLNIWRAADQTQLTYG